MEQMWEIMQTFTATVFFTGNLLALLSIYEFIISLLYLIKCICTNGNFSTAKMIESNSVNGTEHFFNLNLIFDLQ